MKLNELTINQAAEGLSKGEFTSVDLTKACLEQIEKLDDEIKAFLRVRKDEALKEAEESDERLRQSKSLGPVDGIPYNLKDVFAHPDSITTAASKILEHFNAIYEATTVKRLRESGAVLLGLTNTDEFTMGSSTETSYFETTANPWDKARVPGGSSGGAVAAVAARMSFFGIGTDTGGSIRQPASLCGVVGIKPTYGRVSRYGEFPMASSLDQTGPITRTVEDAALVLSVIAGHDPLDSTSLPKEIPSDWSKLSPSSDLSNITIGIPKEFYGEGISPETEKLVREAIEVLIAKGAKTKEVSLPNVKYGLPVYYILAPAEVSSNLARYDGIHYGYSALNDPAHKPDNLFEVYAKSRQVGFGPEVKRRIMLGTYVLSSGYYDAYYKKAQKVRALLKQDYERAFQEVDLLITPVSPTPAFKIGEKTTDPLEMYKADILTISINLAGLPGMAVPCGFENNLPVGMQLIGPQLGESVLFKVGQAYQSTTDWQAKSPNLN